MKIMDYESLVQECKRLRALHERAEAEFFIFMMVAEREHKDIWAGAGCVTFDQFIRSNHLGKVDRYGLFVHGVNRCGVDAALNHGAAWTIEAGKIENATPEVLAQFAARAQAFTETERVAPSEEAVREWRAQIDTRTKVHGTIRKVDELNRLRAENEVLRVELRAAKRRISELEKTVSKKMKASTQPSL
jgi:hypothetical protein